VSPIIASPLSLADRIEDLLPQTQCTKCGYPACRPYAEAIADGTASYDQCPPGGAEGIARLAALLGKPVIPLNAEHGLERARPVARIDEAICIGCTLCIQACPVDAIVGAAKRMHTVVESLCTGCDLCVALCPVDCIAMIPVTGEATGWDAWSQARADDARARHDVHLARERQARAAAEQRIADRHAAHQARLASPAPAATVDAPTVASASGMSSTSISLPVQATDDDAARTSSRTGAAPASSGAQGAMRPAPTASSDEAPRVHAIAPGGTVPPSGPVTNVAPAPLSPDERKKAIIAAALERARQKKAELAEHGQGPKNTEHVSDAVQAQIDEADARRKRLGIDEDDT
jgi:electron transport complex protein RnfB